MLTEPERRALTVFMGEVVLKARQLAWACAAAPHRISGEREAEIAALLDLIHTLPSFLLKGDGWDASRFLEDLDTHDRRWPPAALRARYEALLRGPG